MIYLAGLLLAAAYFIHQYCRRLAGGFGKVVTDRRWEVDNGYTRPELVDWISGHPQDAAGYTSILIPWDIAMAACLGFGLALACFTAGRVIGLPTLLCGALLVIPAAFVAFDANEDLSLARLLAEPGAITEASVAATRMITGWKLLAIKAALAQTAIAILAAVVFSLRGAS